MQNKISNKRKAADLVKNVLMYAATGIILLFLVFLIIQRPA